VNARPSRTRIWPAVILALALILGILPAPVTAHPLADAAPIVVDTTSDSLAVDGLCSLREAINAVNIHAVVDTCGAAGGFDLIMLPAGTYALTIPGASEDENATGDLDIKASVTIEGAGPQATIIDASGLDRVMHIHGNASATLHNVTVQGGHAPDGALFTPYPEQPWWKYASRGEDGGGIYNGGTLALTHCVVRHNRAGVGNSGISFDTDLVASEGGSGGGIFSSGDLQLTTTQVSDNAAGPGGDCWCPSGSSGRAGGVATSNG
jgi:CSLREA domain-containing protein